MAEYIATRLQEVTLNSPIIFSASIPCRRNLIYHEDETGIFILRGCTDQCFASYQVTFNGNVSLPEESDVVPIALALVTEGEVRPSSLAIFTPQDTDEFGNLTSTAIVRVPKGCCFTLAVEYVSPITDPTVTPAPVINVQNANLVINRIA